MTKSVTKIQDKDGSKRLSVVRSTADPTKYGVVILNPDGSKISGPKGDPGDAATITVGTTTTGNPGTNANVVNVGTTSAAVLDFTIPRGDKGNTGATGNGIASVTSEKSGKTTTVTITETNGDDYSFTVSDGADGEGAGDVLGPNSSTDGDVVLFDGNTGKVIKDGGKKLSDLVQTSGNQSIGGQKTFTTSPLVPSKSTDAGNNPTYIATEAQVKKVKDAIPSVVDNLESTSTTSALSANQGRVLEGRISTVEARGRFLSNWNATTGLPVSFPESIPYTYSTGDYFDVTVVSSANPPVNYRPNGSSYTGTASSTAETDDLAIGDTYVYDGTNWLLQQNHNITTSFASISGEPTDNLNLATALGEKQDKLIAGSNITIGSDGKTISATDTTYSTATSSVEGLVKLGSDTVQTETAQSPSSTAGKTYPIQLNSSNQAVVNVPWDNTTYSGATSSVDGLVKLGSDTVQSVNAEAVSGDVGRTYAIQNDSDGKMVVNVPRTQAVSSVNGDTGAVIVNDVKVEASEPTPATEGMAWYDTTNDTLKMYDGTCWKATGGGAKPCYVDVFLVGGGGGGGGAGFCCQNGTNYCGEGQGGGGGGGGGVTLQYRVPVTAASTYVAVGGGGTGGAPLSSGGNGGDTRFGCVCAMGGGGGGRGGCGLCFACNGCYGGNGGGGGGGWHCTCVNCTCAGVQEGGGVAQPGGFPGGQSTTCACGINGVGAGGGGAGGRGGCLECKGNSACWWGGNGGYGIKNYWYCGCACCYAGGGGGGGKVGYSGSYDVSYLPQRVFDGGGRGGFAGKVKCGCKACNGTANTGGGGGGGFGVYDNSSYPASCGVGGNGGSGIAIIRYPTDGSYGFSCATGGTVVTYNGFRVHRITSSTNFCIMC